MRVDTKEEVYNILVENMRSEDVKYIFADGYDDEAKVTFENEYKQQKYEVEGARI